MALTINHPVVDMAPSQENDVAHQINRAPKYRAVQPRHERIFVIGAAADDEKGVEAIQHDNLLRVWRMG